MDSKAAPQLPPNTKAGLASTGKAVQQDMAIGVCARTDSMVALRTVPSAIPSPLALIQSPHLLTQPFAQLARAITSALLASKDVAPIPPSAITSPLVALAQRTRTTTSAPTASRGAVLIPPSVILPRLPTLAQRTAVLRLRQWLQGMQF